jgi:hypothetical protein
MTAPNIPLFRNMSEMTTYLCSLEQRITSLETENIALTGELERIKPEMLLSLPKSSEEKIPKTRLLSERFITRAFAVWGHFFVAQLIISIPFVICYVIFIVFSLSKYIPSP